MKQLLVEKYRPQTIEEYVFQNDNVRNNVIKWLEAGEIPNILMHSKTPGSGKSTMSRLLVKELDIDPSDVKYVNVSLVKGMDFIRDELEPWLKKTGFSSFKIVQLEEMDKLSIPAQQSLRSVIEDYSDRVRFIGTCNYVQKLEPAIVSRFQQLDLDKIDEGGVFDLVARVIEGEGLTFEDENHVFSHIQAYSPDMRKVLNSIDGHTDSNKVIQPLSEVTEGVDSAAWGVIWGDSTQISLEELLPLTESVDANNFEWFYQVIYENSQSVDGDQRGKLVTLCSKYLDRAYRCANQRLHLDAFLYEYFLFNDE